MSGVQVYWSEKDLFSRQGQSIETRNCPTRRTLTGYCRCEKCDVCDYGKHAALHGPFHGKPVGSAPWGHEFVPRMTPAEIEAQAEILKSLGR